MHIGFQKGQGGVQNEVRHLRGSWKVGDEGM